MNSDYIEPTWMQHLLAKSADRSEGDQPETLARHTWLVLEKVAQLAQIRPNLTTVAGTPDFWHLLYWSCFLHDFGKATGGFQQQLSGVSWDGHRHEVVSLAFADWIIEHFPPEQQIWLVAAVASHHRDCKKITERYGSLLAIEQAWGSFNPADVPHLWRWIVECGNQWINELGLDHYAVRPLKADNQQSSIERVQQQGSKRIHHWRREYSKFVKQIRESHQVDGLQTLILLRGLVITADHAASAHLQQLPAPIQLSWQELAQRVLAGRYEPYEHQRASAAAYPSSALLIAPTGSGKTEAALYWALGDGSRPVARIFYALPYQASMNAMFDRLRDEVKGFGEQAVGLQHGRAFQALYLRLLEADEVVTSRQAAERGKWENNINRLHARPIKMFSPYQMLKALFQIKGFEALLADYAQAAFIFDEIHAYEPGRLALIITLIKFLREHFAARFFIMSATFPDLIRTKLYDALGTDLTVTADNKVFQQFARHRLELCDGELTDPFNIEQIVQDFKKGKQVLVCANTVRRAQSVYNLLEQAGVPEQQLMLIHSRFITKDRNELEAEIIRRTQLGLTEREPLILVATQVVEVSLNIDLDTIYTDPAPLEALLQRFGRVNRERKKGICAVYVFRQPTDGQGVYGRSKEESLTGRIVQVTLDELEKHAGEVIDEAQINDWLNTIYADSILQEQWNAAYDSMFLLADQIMHSLRPFDSDDKTQEQFEEMFDNIDVLPKCFVKIYVNLINQHDYVEASRYFVGISKQKYAQFARQGLIHALEEASEKRSRWVINLPYSKETGLSFEPGNIDDLWGDG